MKSKLFFLALVIGLSFVAKANPPRDIFSPFTVNLKEDDTAYQQLWTEVISLDEQELTKDAMAKVKDIETLARRDKNYPHIIKTLLVTFTYEKVLKETNLWAQLKKLDAEIAQMPMPHKAVLQSITASAWLNITDRRSYYDETNIEPDSTDPTTWPDEEILKRAERYLLQSVLDRDATMAIRTTDYGLLLLIPDLAEQFTPTLHDVLMYRLYEFYNHQVENGKDTDTASPPASLLVGNVEEFIQSTIIPVSSSSYKLKGLRILQGLLGRFLAAGLTDALILTDIERLEFCARSYPESCTFGLQLEWFDRQIEKHKPHHLWPEFLLRAARIMAGEYSNNNWDTYIFYPENIINKRKAIKYCQWAIESFPDEAATESCRALKKHIELKELKVQVEYTNSAKKPFRLFIEHKNTPKIYLRYIAIEEDSILLLEKQVVSKPDREQSKIKTDALLSWPVAAIDSLQMPIDTNYLQSTAEWYHPGLKEGHYILLYSTTNNFNPDAEGTGYVNFWSSDYILYSTKEGAGSTRYFIANAADNKPQKDIQLVISNSEYNNIDKTWTKQIIKDAKTDKNGTVQVSVGTYYYGVRVEAFKKGKKIISSSSNFYMQSEYGYAEQTEPQVHFVTDRGIYRPGQTVYFKGYLMRPGNRKKGTAARPVAAGFGAKITLQDPNYEDIETVDVEANEYGSFSGSFTIPYGRLTGYYNIETQYGSHGFYVEEYKRPKFNIKFDTIPGNPGFNDTVTVTGKAMAYAGNALAGASANYVVTRDEPSLYWGPKSYQREEEQIAQGNLTLDDKGNFVIKFVALPGVNDWETITYSISVFVTDITGETQTEQLNYRIAKQNLFVAIEAPTLVFAGSNAVIELTGKNLNEKKIPFTGTLSITEILKDKEVKKQLNWVEPQVQLIPKKIFNRYFKNQTYQYANPTEQKGKTVFSSPIKSTTGVEKIDWNTNGIAQGHYEVKMEYLDNNGIPQITLKQLSIANTKGKKAFLNKTLEVVTTTPTVQPGQTAEIIISSRCPKTIVWYYIERNGVAGELQSVKLKNSLHKLTIPVTETDRGGIVVTAFTVLNNRFYESFGRVEVPWSNKELKVEVTAYRDKMVPGDKEEWQLKVTGPEAQKVSAEVVASMYDASLDMFTQNGWDNFLNNYQSFNYTSVDPSPLSNDAPYPKPLSPYFGGDFSIIKRSPAGFNFYRWVDDFQGWTLQGLGLMGGSGFGSGGGGASEGGGGGGRRFKGVKREDNSNSFNTDAYLNESQNKEAAAPMKNTYQFTDAVLKDDASNSNSGGATLGQSLAPQSMIKVRRNLQETAFFYPHLQTDDSSKVLVKFVAPEALTQWNFRAFAHTKEMAGGFALLQSVTQKPLMVQPALPRFLREGDEIYITTKVANLSDKVLAPNVVLEIYDATTGKNIKEYNNLNVVQIPQLAIGGSEAVKWKLTVPAGYGALKMVIKAYDGNFTDAEANTLPVLSDKILVTEALPIAFSGNKPKTFELKKLVESGKSTTLKNHKLTVEFTANPAWYAIQALPYMMEYPHECAEQVFNRFYANTLARHIALENPAIREVYDSWKAAAEKGDEGSFVSNLEKNEELKSLLLAETPWLTEGSNETERKQRLGMLFDDNIMAASIGSSLQKLANMQLGNGAFPWFTGMGDNRNITQYIVTGAGKLKKITGSEENLEGLELSQAMEYLHREAAREYEEAIKKSLNKKTKPGFSAVQYLYAISFFFELDNDFAESIEEYVPSINYWQTQLAQTWQGRSRMEQGMIALALYRFGDTKTAQAIIKALSQNAITNPDNGMYWKEMTGGYGWTDAPIETQSLLIEAFDEIAKDEAAVMQMRKWLLKQKQLSDWETTRATADACYALLVGGGEWLTTENNITINVGSKTIDPQNDPEINTEAGTGYFKKSFSGEEIQPDMGKVTLTPQNGANTPMAWGGMYWQYFEKLDKITRAQTPLSLLKQLYIENNTDSGAQKTLLKPGDKLKTGDKIVVRILLKVNNDMEYVYLKDMRASGLEPTDFLSGYKWQNGVGYYQSIRDASMNFFFDRLPKGQWMFEYTVRVSQAGTFQNGIATVQSMYAPEYTSHSEGMVIVVEP